MVRVTNENMAGGNIRSLGLRVAAQAKIGVVVHEQFLIDGTMRVMTNGASFTHGFVFENHRACLRLVTTRAALILSRHRQAALGLENVAPVRVMAIHAIHESFHDGMVLRQTELRLDVQMALETGGRLFAWVNDEGSRAAGPNMFAARPVAGFAAALPSHGRAFDVQARVGAGREFPEDIAVAIGAGLVADVVRAGNGKRRHSRGRTRCAGDQSKCHTGRKANCGV